MMMQNGDLANPRNKFARRMKELMVAKKKPKADKDAIQDILCDVEWEGGLYWNAKLGPHLPAEMIRACLIQGAKLSKGGASVKRTCFVLEDAKLEYKGPRDLESLKLDPAFRDERMCVVNGKRVLKTRPVFRDWKATVAVQYMPQAVAPEDITKYMTDAGLYIGIGTARGLGFGRFDCTPAKAKRTRKTAAAAK